MVKLFIYIFLIFIVACDRNQSPPTNIPTTAEKIQNAQYQSLRNLNPYSVKKGQRVHHIETQEIVSSQAPIKSMSKEWETLVTYIQEDSYEKEITTIKTVVDKFWDDQFIYKFKSIYNLEKIETLELLDQLDKKRFSLQNTISAQKEAGQIEESEIDGVAFSNLKVKKVVLNPPELVSADKNCKGLKNCKINADKISYNIIFLLKDGKTQTHNIDWFVSAEVPFFAGILKQCATTVVPIESIHVLVKQCEEVVDFDHQN